jgi:hypothetical protein
MCWPTLLYCWFAFTLCIASLVQIEALLQPLVIGDAPVQDDEDVGQTVGKTVDTPVRSAQDEELWQLARIHLTGMVLQARTPVQEQLALAVSDRCTAILSV